MLVNYHLNVQQIRALENCKRINHEPQYQGAEVETLAGKMSETQAMIGWLTLLYLVCVLCKSAK